MMKIKLSSIMNGNANMTNHGFECESMPSKFSYNTIAQPSILLFKPFVELALRYTEVLCFIPCILMVGRIIAKQEIGGG